MARTLILTTTFLSAFLLFTIQPLYAKFLLPQFGGTSSVWTISVFFYSFVLVIGYLYASQITQWSSKVGRYIHSALLIVSGALLLSVWLQGGVPPLINVVPYFDPAFSVLLTLFAGLGLPIVLLASVSVLMQTLYARLTAREPYQLYALSNAGSLLGLASYPFLFEPNFDLHTQALVWTIGFLLCVFCIITAWREVEKTVSTQAQEMASVQATKLQFRLRIIGLAAVPTFFLVSITEFLSKGIASFPLLWIIPLILYLLSFITAFAHTKPSIVNVPQQALVLVSAIPVLLLLKIMNSSVLLFMSGFVYSMIFFYIVSVYFHTEVYKLRPKNMGMLGTFYVLVTVGGAIGSGVVGVLLPMILNDTIELYTAVCGLTLFLVFRHKVIVWAQTYVRSWVVTVTQFFVVSLALAVFVALVLDTSHLDAQRNFYGTLKIAEKEVVLAGETEVVRSIVNGSISHGIQVVASAYSNVPLSYYGEGTGVDIAIQYFQDKGTVPIVSVIGLGAGVINGYCSEVAQIDYIEINPQVEYFARKHFTYLELCPEKTSVSIGDGRLLLQEMAAASSAPYDVIVIDAFTDDAIPAHLLTTEAFSDAYLPNLSKEGVVAIHISNKFLDLYPVIAGMAKENGYEALFVHTELNPENTLQYSTDWVLIAKPEQGAAFSEYATVTQYPVQSIVWSDQKSSVMDVLSLFGSAGNRYQLANQ